jgi:HKD family nuclease
MKLITTNKELVINLLRMEQTYKSIAFAVAWASARTEVFRQLIKNRTHIKKAVIGTHFYQTHPDVLDAFIGSKNVRFIMQPKGIFHPKIYLFWNPTHWEALIGSANLTSAALTNNSEVMALLSNSDQISIPLKTQTIGLIDSYWSEATQVNKSDALAYREVWQRQQPALRRLSGQYGKSKTRKSPVSSSVMSMSWKQFLTAVKQDEHHGFHERCELLQMIRSEFDQHNNFASMKKELRKTIAGLPNDRDERWAWFGSMKGAGSYFKAVNENNKSISKALDKIPLHGTVSRSQYESYVSEFIKGFPNGRHGIATVSRLLTMKRPDQFVCLDSKNQRELCKDFGIKQTGMNYERYWEEIVERIMDSPWWNYPMPNSKKEKIVWDGRAAMLDTIFYRP